ncbi:substrate-binding domain-containing protein, partial [Schleiferilactobacillus perolens]
VFETEYNFRAGAALWDKLQAVGADAAYIADDELAIGVLDGAIDRGIKVPDDFQIITSNNTVLTEMARPQLSSISQPLYDIGAVAMRLLTKMMNKEAVTEKTVLLPFTITERQSTKA